MKAASLFAGVGGFDLAMSRLGIRSALVSEIDPAARRVLASRFPHARQEGDARLVDLRGFDLVTAGFPCQGLSNAASTRSHSGLIDPRSRSNIVWSILDRIHEARVPLVALENSSALTTARYADDMKALLATLAGHGYDARVYVLNSGCYRSPMRRLRAFVLASSRPMTWPSASVSSRWECLDPLIGVSGQQGGATWCVQPSPTLKSGSYTLCVTRDDVRSLTPEALESLMGMEPGHTAAAGSNAQRYERLGNAVSVDAAEGALRILLGLAPSPVRPPRDYPTTLTVSARGGTSGSMVRRFYRSAAVAGRARNYNLIEQEYALPVYARRMMADPATVSLAQRDALAWLIDHGVVPARPKPWPASAVAQMIQPGLLPRNATIVVPPGVEGLS